MEKMHKAILFKDETEKAIVHFIVYLIGKKKNRNKNENCIQKRQYKNIKHTL